MERLLDSLPSTHHGGPRVYASAQPGWSAASGGSLYHRLAVLLVSIPPLRERTADLPAVLEGLLVDCSSAAERTAPRPTNAQLERLKTYHWPGNLREASAVCERAVVFGASAFDLPQLPGETRPDLEAGFSLSQHLEAEEQRLLVLAIRQSGGDRSIMSRLLDVERNTLRYKLNKYGLLDRT
jgi:DNA-binding NtrC family response regulator